MEATTLSRDRIRRLVPILLWVAVLAPLLVGVSGLSVLAAPSAPQSADSVVVVVSAENPTTEISRLHLADLYLGRTSRFPDGRPAEPVDQAPGSPAREAFYESYLGRSPAEIKSHWSKLIFTGRGRPPGDVPDGEEMRKLVAGNPNSIGYLRRSLVDRSVRVVKVR